MHAIGRKPRDSDRCWRLIDRARGIIKTHIDAALACLVDLHRKAEIVVERLALRMQRLSRRADRIITDYDRGVFKVELADQGEKFGMTVAGVNAAYIPRGNANRVALLTLATAGRNLSSSACIAGTWRKPISTGRKLSVPDVHADWNFVSHHRASHYCAAQVVQWEMDTGHSAIVRPTRAQKAARK